MALEAALRALSSALGGKERESGYRKWRWEAGLRSLPRGPWPQGTALESRKEEDGD